MPLIHSHGIGNQTFIEQAGESANGVIFPIGKLIVAEDLADSDPQKDVVSKYAMDYEEKYKLPRSTFGGYAWDAMGLILTALEKSGDNPTSAQLRDEIEKIKDFKGISGVFNFSAQDHNGLVDKDMVMVEISEGKWKLLEN